MCNFLFRPHTLQLSNTAFCNVEFFKIDFKKDVVFVFSKVFNHGLWNDMKWCEDEYGEEKVVEILKSIPYLNDDRLRLSCVIFKTNQNKFRSHTKKQQMPIAGGF